METLLATFLPDGLVLEQSKGHAIDVKQQKQSSQNIIVAWR